MSNPNPFDDPDLPSIDIASGDAAPRGSLFAVCPITGEVFPAEDDREIDRTIDHGISLVSSMGTDDIIDAFIKLDAVRKVANTLVEHIRRTIGDRVKRLPGDSATRYISGDRRKAKVVLPGLKFSGKALREAWDKYPQFRDELLKISGIDVKISEYKKAAKTAFEGERLKFVTDVVKAEEEPTAAPTVEVVQ